MPAPSGMTRPVAEREFAQKGLRRRDMPGLKALPTVMTSPPTITVGAAAGATQISGSVLISPADQSAFTYWGCDPAFGGSTFPGSNYFVNANQYPSTKTTYGPWGGEFMLNSPDGLFEVSFSGKGVTGAIRVLVNGQYTALAPVIYSATSDGSSYLALVNLGAAGRYRIGLECSGGTWLGGIRVSPTSGVRAAPRRTKRIWLIGDSFSEYTIIDTTTVCGGDGYGVRLGYAMNCDVRAAGSGGTGFVNIGPNPRVKFRDRLSDIIGNLRDDDEVWWFGGLNDYAYPTTGTANAATFASEVALCLAAITAANPKVQQRVFSPFFPRAIPGSSVTNLLMWNDILKNAAAAAVPGGLPFYDSLRQGVTLGNGILTAPANSTNTNAITAFASNTLVSAVNYGQFAHVELGTGLTTAEVRQVASVTGTGPYTHTVSGNWGLTHTAGETVRAVGPSHNTGATGNQGTTTGLGTSDRYTGGDGTHPTREGHDNLALNIYELVYTTLAA